MREHVTRGLLKEGQGVRGHHRADDGVPPNTPCLMNEISKMLYMDEARSLKARSRSEFAMFEREAEATESEADKEQEHSNNLVGERQEVCPANTEEEDTSDTDSVSTVAYYKEDRYEERPRFEDKSEEVILISEDDEK